MRGVLTARPSGFSRYVNLVRGRRCRQRPRASFRGCRESALGVAKGRLTTHRNLVVQPICGTPHNLQQHDEPRRLAARLRIRPAPTDPARHGECLRRLRPVLRPRAIAGFVGFALSMLTAWKKLRGIYAGVAFLGACASMLYASFSIVFTIPKAALQRPGIPGGAQFAGQSVGAYTLSWAPQLAWFLAIG